MKRLLCFLAGWGFIAALLVFSVSAAAFNKSFYQNFYENSRLSQILDTKPDQIMMAMDMMLDYLQEKRADLEGTIVRSGSSVQVYNAREKAHMKDVLALYKKAKLAGVIAALLCIAIAAYILIRYKKEGLYDLAIGFRDACFCFLILLFFLGLWAATNFTDFWIHFHELFFDNDLWILDPKYDFMICICPEDLFFQLIMRIAATFLVLYIPVLIVIVIYCHRKVYQRR